MSIVRSLFKLSMSVLEHFKHGGMPNQQPGCVTRINKLAQAVFSSIEQTSNYIEQAYRPHLGNGAIVCEARIVKTIPSSPESVIIIMSDQPGILKIRIAESGHSSSNEHSNSNRNVFHLFSYGNLYVDSCFQMETMEYQYPVEESKNNKSGRKHKTQCKK